MTETVTPPTCERLVFVRGQDRRCGQSVGLSRWTDHTGRPHAGCPNHVESMKRRYPETEPQRVFA